MGMYFGLPKLVRVVFFYAWRLYIRLALAQVGDC
jgi:hypothetical protein